MKKPAPISPFEEDYKNALRMDTLYHALHMSPSEVAYEIQRAEMILEALTTRTETTDKETNTTMKKFTWQLTPEQGQFAMNNILGIKCGNIGTATLVITISDKPKRKRKPLKIK